MATTITIPTIALQVGATTFGPRNMAKEHTVVLTIDRTVASGLNSLDATTLLEVDVNTSADGTTWANEASFTTVGGTINDKHGIPVGANVLTIEGLGGQGNHVEVVATVGGGSPVTVAGTIVLT